MREQEKVISELKEINKQGSQALISLVKKAIEGKEVSAIYVNKGPGSYTGLKVGVSVANALGFALGLPVNGKKLETDLNY